MNSEVDKDVKVHDDKVKLIDFLTKHLAVISALAIIIGVFSATVFLYAYLRVFDWRLIWLVEYTDILKFGLIAIAVISGFNFIIWSFVHDAYKWTGEHAGSIRSYIIIIGGIWAISAAVNLYNQYNSDDPHYVLILFLHFSVFCLGGAAFSFLLSIRKPHTISAKFLITDAMTYTAMLFVFGTTLGYYMRDTEGFTRNVFLEGSELKNVGVVLITSQHVVLYGSDKITVVPVSDVKRIEREKSVSH